MNLSDDFRRRFDAAAAASIAAEESEEFFLGRSGARAGATARRYETLDVAVRGLLLEAARSYPGLEAVRARGRIWKLARGLGEAAVVSIREEAIGE